LREPLTTDEAAMVESDAAIEDAAPETRDPPVRDPTCDPPLFPSSLPFPLFSGCSGVNVTCPKYQATQQLRHRIKTRQGFVGVPVIVLGRSAGRSSMERRTLTLASAAVVIAYSSRGSPSSSSHRLLVTYNDAQSGSVNPLGYNVSFHSTPPAAKHVRAQ
jgi:hypothetical protein